MIRRTLTVVSSSFFCVSMALAAGAGAGQAGNKGDAAKGKDLVSTQCSVCHNVDTDEQKMGPSLKGLFKRSKLKNGKPVNDANVMAQINNGGGGMPGYADTLTATDKANILAYLHTL